jgi:bifunctional DNase/RNase
VSELPGTDDEQTTTTGDDAEHGTAVEPGDGAHAAKHEEAHAAAQPDAATGAEVTDLPAGDATAGDGSAPDSEVAAAYATFVPVEVVSLVYDLPAPSPVIHLREDDPPFRGIDFPIGLPEAQSIALALEGERAPRPSSHDLLAAALVAAGCDLVAVRLTGVRGGTIHAELDLSGPRGREVLDCRPTDGIAVALRMPVPAPILADVTLLA